MNNIGLTIQTVPNNRVILCKIANNKPSIEKPTEDYIYIGSTSTTTEITETVMLRIIRFVASASGQKSEIKNMSREWRNGLRMYGKSIAIESKENSGKYPIMEDSQ